MVLLIYSKPNCSLCEQAKAELYALQERLPFELREVDIRLDPALFARYRFEIPVVTLLDGAEVSRHRIDLPAVERLIRGGMRVADSTGD